MLAVRSVVYRTQTRGVTVVSQSRCSLYLRYAWLLDPRSRRDSHRHIWLNEPTAQCEAGYTCEILVMSPSSSAHGGQSDITHGTIG